MYNIMQKASTNQNSPQSPVQADLRRSILGSSLKGQQQAQLINLDLRQQGTKLKESLDDAKLIAKEVNLTTRAVNKLNVEVKTSKWSRLCVCIRSVVCCCCCSRCNGEKHEEDIDVNFDDELGRRIREGYKSLSQNDNDEEDESDLVDLNQMRNIRQNEESKWRQTLVPLSTAQRGYSNEPDMWYRQVDAGLTHLQFLTEDMGQSLEEQIRLAQMLSIYLNYGVDQVMVSNQKMTEVEALV